MAISAKISPHKKLSAEPIIALANPSVTERETATNIETNAPLFKISIDFNINSMHPQMHDKDPD